MGLEFTQEEIETALADKLPHGCRREVARISGLGESYIKRQFNPHDETASCVFRVLQIVCSLDEIDPQLGDEFWKEIVGFRQASKRTADLANYSVDAEAAELSRENGEFFAAVIKSGTWDERWKEFIDVEIQLKKVKSALIAEKTNSKFTTKK